MPPPSPRPSRPTLLCAPPSSFPSGSAAASARPPPRRPPSQRTRASCATYSCSTATPRTHHACSWCSRASAVAPSSTPSSPRCSTSPVPSRGPATASNAPSPLPRARHRTSSSRSSGGRNHAVLYTVEFQKFLVFPWKYVFRPVEGHLMIKFTKCTELVERTGMEAEFPFYGIGVITGSLGSLKLFSMLVQNLSAFFLKTKQFVDTDKESLAIETAGSVNESVAEKDNSPQLGSSMEKDNLPFPDQTSNAKRPQSSVPVDARSNPSKRGR